MTFRWRFDFSAHQLIGQFTSLSARLTSYRTSIVIPLRYGPDTDGYLLRELEEGEEMGMVEKLPPEF